MNAAPIEWRHECRHSTLKRAPQQKFDFAVAAVQLGW
jgi:hypothetical protein